ncbi:probable disease resistance protein At4g27220 [Prosopis cineraria]|uniref:probable disease resistance protein At4g27220 n=1 Tax=Prosopis cineraria TaxID=364024 RepID=UPI002410B0A1|nr:probable disease resistance protein At4g27220 [Prosopis cineraria]
MDEVGISVAAKLVEYLVNNGCFQRWCPTWKRYRLCKALAKTTQRMIGLNTKSDKFERFSHHVIVPDVEYNSSKDFMFFKSIEMACNELWEVLEDDESSIIGLWGMGGSSKTTLVKEIGKKAKESKLFYQVIITTVSQTLNIRNIHGKIADLLGVKLEEETEMGKARRITMKLQSLEEHILIILDDVWATLNLEDIGNLVGEEGLRNCKVLLTTRRQEVYALIDCQKIVPLDLLIEDEAWALFQTHTRLDGVREVAQEVAVECKGLPIVIVVIRKCLKGKGLDEVSVVLHKLRHSKPIDVDKTGSDAFTCLNLSYDYLRSAEVKLLFLMCVMFPEDHEIFIKDLFRYGVGLSLCKDANSFEIARSQVVIVINVLIDSSLMMYSLNFMSEKCVKMHDMVRDTALWIASKENYTIMANFAKEFNEFLEDEVVKDYCAISSWNKNDEFLQFPSLLDAPRLEFLLLNSSKPLDLSNASFEGVQRLKVVTLINNNFVSSTKLLPQSMSQLSNLRSLHLQGYTICYECFVDILALSKLRRYTLKMGQCKQPIFWNKGMRELSFGELNISISSLVIKDLVQRAIVIEFYELHEGYKRFNLDVVQAIGDNVEESEDEDDSVDFDHNDIIEFETTHRFIDLSSPRPPGLYGEGPDPSQSKR